MRKREFHVVIDHPRECLKVWIKFNYNKIEDVYERIAKNLKFLEKDEDL